MTPRAEAEDEAEVEGRAAGPGVRDTGPEGRAMDPKGRAVSQEGRAASYRALFSSLET